MNSYLLGNHQDLKVLYTVSISKRWNGCSSKCFSTFDRQKGEAELKENFRMFRKIF